MSGRDASSGQALRLATLSEPEPLAVDAPGFFERRVADSDRIHRLARSADYRALLSRMRQSLIDFNSHVECHSLEATALGDMAGDGNRILAYAADLANWIAVLNDMMGVSGSSVPPEARSIFSGARQWQR